MAAPGAPPGRIARESEERRAAERRIAFIAWAANQMGLVGKIAQVVVEPARPGVGPVQDLLQAAKAFRIAAGSAQLGELNLEPFSIVERHIDRIEAGPT